MRNARGERRPPDGIAPGTAQTARQRPDDRTDGGRDENGRGWIEAEGRGAARIPPAEERWRRILSGISGGPVETAEICRADGETRVTFRERDRMELEMEAQSGRAAGGPACGDCTAYLRLRSGERFLLLSDGMGHGEAAAEEARRALDTADVVLAKGQGNYESLSGQGRHVFYAFLCKCDLFTTRFGVPPLTGMLVEETA